MSDVRFNNVALSQSRLARIEGAQTLNEAQRMGLFDRAVDWFRGGVKREAIKQAFDMLRAPEGGGAAPPPSHEGLLLHFNILQNALRAEHTDKCQLIVQRDDGAQTWSYRMELDGKPLVSATGLPMQSGHTLAAFEDHALLANLGNYLQQRFGADSVDQREVLQEKFAAINAGHADLTGDVATSATLEKFRVLCASLALLGAANKGCPPHIELSSALATAELRVGNHVLGQYPISSQAVLTDTLATKVQVCAISLDHVLQARDVEKEVLDTAQDMVDDETERAKLQGKFHDGFFCSANFVSVRVLEKVGAEFEKFEATFRDESAGGETRTLVFSNRATAFEMRGVTLQKKLAAGGYETLADLISQRLGTAEDSLITYGANFIRNEVGEDMSWLDDEDVRGRLGFSDQAAAKAYCEDVKKNVIAPIVVGKTNLAQLWQLDTSLYGSLRQPPPDQVDSAQAADDAPPPLPAQTQSHEMAMLAAYKA